MIACDAGAGLPTERREELLTWLRGLGLNPAMLRPTFSIDERCDSTANPAFTYRLHLDVFVLRPDGRNVLHPTEPNTVATRPIVVEFTTADWPSWLTEQAVASRETPELGSVADSAAAIEVAQ